MAEPVRIAILGLTHDHVWGHLQDVCEHPAADLVAVADPHAVLREKATEIAGCAAYDSYEKALDREQPDAVYVFADNATGVELVGLAAVRGLPAMIEKPLAHKLAGADRATRAAGNAGTRLMVNWPFAWWPQMQHALAVAKSGELGRLWQVKYRAAHAGPAELGCSEYFCEWLFDAERNGGGALIDYCCYGALLARLLLGVPQRVYGSAGRLTKQELPVEDNAVLVMSYTGAMAVSEASWSQIGNLSSYVTMIYGTEATLLIEPRIGGRLLLATRDQPDGRPLEVPEPAPEMRGATAHFLARLADGQPFAAICQAEPARDAQEILEAGLKSANSGSEVALPIEF